MTIPAVSSQRVTSRSEEEEKAASTETPCERPPSELPRTTQQKIDSDLVAYANNASTTAPRPNDQILYVGMNDESWRAEIAALGGSSVARVLRQEVSSVRLDSVDYDLTTKEGCTLFAETLAKKYRLGPEASTRISAALQSLNPGARDELARIAMKLAPGEIGKPIPSRLVFSGHSTGRDIHHGPAELTFHSILALGRAMPLAARQIEDVHFSGCFTAEQIDNSSTWRQVFPNVKTMWGYSSFTPDGLNEHLKAWEVNTRGRAATNPAGRRAVSTWSQDEGFRDAGVTLGDLKKAVGRAEDRFFGHYSGAEPSPNPHTGWAAADYATYRRLSTHRDVPLEQQKIYEAKAEVLYRVRFYEKSLRAHFAETHGASINRAFAAVGLPRVDFASLSRSDALAVIDRFEQRLRERGAGSTGSEEIAKATSVLRGLRLLDPQTIPQEWLHD